MKKRRIHPGRLAAEVLSVLLALFYFKRLKGKYHYA